MLTFECLNCLTDIIGNANNKAGLVLQCLHIFSNLGENWNKVYALHFLQYIDLQDV